MKKVVLFMIFLLVLAGSCKKKIDTTPGTVVTPAMARDTLYYIMKQWYYWYDLMPSVTKENYTDPSTLLEAMRYKTLDRWSFVADYDAFNAEMQGSFVGHGIRIGIDGNSNARISMIYKNSPLYLQGVRRGWIIKMINNTDIAPLIISGNATAYNNVIGAATAGVTNTFIFQKPDGSQVTISSTKSEFNVNTVLLYDTLHISTGVAGHLVLESFIQPTEAELKTAFSYFKSCNINSLILDLRYNSGGYLFLAQQLASYIAGNGLTNTTFATLQYNNKNQTQNSSYPFITTLYPLTVSKLVVITTRLTASASEAVMNGLSPHLSYVSIGDTTNGKPTGMNGWPCAKKYFFWPITFKIVNSLNQGDYFKGFAPNKITTDDITHDFNDKNEACLKDAISYLQTGAYTSGKGMSIREFRRTTQTSERPSWMNNLFVLTK